MLPPAARQRGCGPDAAAGRLQARGLRSDARAAAPVAAAPAAEALAAGAAAAAFALAARGRRRPRRRRRGDHAAGLAASAYRDCLREDLRVANGLPRLEDLCVRVLSDADAARAARIFRDSGFVVLLDAVPPELCDALLKGCKSEAAQMLKYDPLRNGNRGRRRYSLGAAQRTGHLLHRQAWAALADLGGVARALRAIFGPEDYVCAGAGGDFVLGDEDAYQNLHSDLNAEGSHARDGAPVVTVNVAVRPLTWENGPTRIIPGTHRLPLGQFRPPRPHSEPEEWRFFTVCPLPAGAAVLRDNRTWHGGTPNLTADTRFLPNCEFAARWWCRGSTSSAWRNPWVLAPRCMPREIFETLSPAGQAICGEVLADQEAPPAYGVRPDLGGGL